jgi:uncharacterized protein YndB with AHSA1/START domain
MRARPSPAADAAGHELVITRVFDAPRSLVFKAWTELEQAAEWWAPRGCIVVSLAMDVRPGGAPRKCMRSADGVEYWRWGVYREVVEPERLAFTYATDDPQSLPGHETLVTVTFAKLGGKTRLTLRQVFLDSPASRASHQGGWSSCLERCACYLAAAH